jgi:hypothetical protein
MHLTSSMKYRIRQDHLKHPTRARFASYVFVMLTLFGLASLGIDRAFAQTEGARRQAGIWQQTQTLLSIEMPQAVPAIAAAARASIGRPIVSERVCIPATAVSRDNLATRLSPITPTSPTFRWTRLDLLETKVTALGVDLSGSVRVEGRVTPILTDILATSQIADPVIGPARRVQRTVIVRLGPC